MGILELLPTHFGFENSMEKGCNSQACSHGSSESSHKTHAAIPQNQPKTGDSPQTSLHSVPLGKLLLSQGV